MTFRTPPAMTMTSPSLPTRKVGIIVWNGAGVAEIMHALQQSPNGNGGG